MTAPDPHAVKDTSTARVQDGTRYVGNQQFQGNGMTRSCGKCLRHRPSGGGRILPVRGWCCKECVA